MSKRGVKAPPQRAAAHSGDMGLHASQTVARTVSRTLGRVPEVTAVLWARVEDVVHVATMLARRSDDAILRVAEQELAVMDNLRELDFEFRTAQAEDLENYLADGYVPILEA